MENQKIAVLSGKDIRKLINRLKDLKANIEIDRPNHKRVLDTDGEKLFSALKYRSGWDCRQ